MESVGRRSTTVGDRPSVRPTAGSIPALCCGVTSLDSVPSVVRSVDPVWTLNCDWVFIAIGWQVTVSDPIIWQVNRSHDSTCTSRHMERQQMPDWLIDWLSCYSALNLTFSVGVWIEPRPDVTCCGPTCYFVSTVQHFSCCLVYIFILPIFDTVLWYIFVIYTVIKF